MNDSEILLDAAELMRHRARAVIDERQDARDDGEDIADWYETRELNDADYGDEGYVITLNDSAHMVGMTPAFALAVAEWLDGCGRELRDSGNYDSCDEPGGIKCAVHLAQAYLGGAA